MELGQEGRRVRDRVGREASVGPCRPIGQAGPMGSSLDSMMLQRIRSREWRQLSCDLGHDGRGEHCEERERPGRRLLQWTKPPCAHKPSNVPQGGVSCLQREGGWLGVPAVWLCCCGPHGMCGVKQRKAVHLIAATKMRSKHQSPQALWGRSTWSHRVPIAPSSYHTCITGPSGISPNIPEATTVLSLVLAPLLHRNSGLQEEVHRGEASPWCQNAHRVGTLESWCQLFLYGPLASCLLFPNLLTKQGLGRIPSVKTLCAVPIL